MQVNRLAFNFLLAVASIAPGCIHGLGKDYIASAPATVYEATDMSPQNMDFDAENNMFVAHSGWYKDQLIHYYKFRMYTPMTYAGLIKPGGSSAEVPMQKIYMVTTTPGALEGCVGNPVIPFHTADGLDYSDFMEIHLVTAPEGYTANQFKSEGDILSSGAEVVASSIIMNIPVVPMGSILQDPKLKGVMAAPIAPVPVWYKGVEVQTYLFEVTDQKAADFFDWTRDYPEDFAFSIPVTQYAIPDFVFAIPIWHVNQYERGVTDNFGGPSVTGMRNIIDLDRADPGYSPLWSVSWVTEFPMDYSADEVSNAADLSKDQGFTFVDTPMYVNCPDIGEIGDPNNLVKALDTFDVQINSADKPSTWILGSDMSLIMQSDVEVSFQTTDGMVIAMTKTNMMGAYEYELMSNDIPTGTTEIMVVAKGQVIRTIPVSE